VRGLCEPVAPPKNTFQCECEVAHVWLQLGRRLANELV